MLRQLWLSSGGEMFLDEEAAVAMLLDDGVIYCGSCKQVDVNSKVSDTTNSICLYVICNDLFAWACADGENISLDDLPTLVKLHQESKNNWGSQIWCCLKRKIQPQSPIKKHMIEDGVWTPELEALELNRYDLARQKIYADKQPKQDSLSTR